MSYYVTAKKMNQYLNLEIEDNDLFPDDAPSGTSFYDLEPENNTACIVKIEHVIKLLKCFIEGQIDDNRVKEYVETLISLNLYEFDDQDDRIHDLISNTIYTLDELKDVNGKISIEDATNLLNKIIN